MALKQSEPDIHDLGAELDLSVVIPLYNEEESIDPAVEEVLGVLSQLPLACELILVNDGSTDATGEKAFAWHNADPRVKVIEFRRNFGQTAGISAGFERAAGRVVVVMDGDQQNDPADIPNLLACLEEGYDVASGWRADRKDKLLHAAPALQGGQRPHLPGDRTASARLRLHPQGLRPGGHRPPRALRGAAPVHSGARPHLGRQGRGDPGEPPGPRARIVEVRHFPNAAGGARPPDRQVPHRLPAEARCSSSVGWPLPASVPPRCRDRGRLSAGCAEGPVRPTARPRRWWWHLCSSPRSGCSARCWPACTSRVRATVPTWSAVPPAPMHHAAGHPRPGRAGRDGPGGG